jgi:acetyl-CoA carboxylase carboxyl transferase subunit alpha
MKILDFEEPIFELYEKIDQLKNLTQTENLNITQEIRRIEKRASDLKSQIFTNLSPDQIVQIARHPNRPDSLSLMRLISDSFVPLKGDRQFRDDPSIVGGLAVIDGNRCMFIGHQKGHDTKENIYRNFGMPHPEGYRKALRLMQMAEKFQLPIITLIDTPGAYPGIEAEERGQAEAIARNLREMSTLTVPIITFVIGEGGSGGALAIGVSNKVHMLEYSIYSVISPEGCASILFRDSSRSGDACKILGITSKRVLELEIADSVIPEPEGGAHRDWECVAKRLKTKTLEDLKFYKNVTKQEILQERYNKFRNIGKFIDSKNN